MTTEHTNHKNKPQVSSNAGKLPGAVKIALAQLFAIFEVVAPLALATSLPLVLLSILSLLDFWKNVTPLAHWLALIGAVGLTATIAGWIGRSIVWPDRRAALRRLEHNGNVPHNALQALEDKPFQNGTPALWDAHQHQMRAIAARAKLDLPKLRNEAVDPLGLRYPLAGLLGIAILVAGDQSPNRLAGGFSPPDPRAQKNLLVDIWIEPPAYTGKAPVHLIRSGAQKTGVQDQINVVEGSIVHMQTEGRGSKLKFYTEDRSVNAHVPDEANKNRRNVALTESGVLVFRAHGQKIQWPIGAIEDTPPLVKFIDGPAKSDDGALSLTITIDDDFGITSSSLEIKLNPDQDRPLDAPSIDAVSLSQTRQLPLEGIAGRAGDRQLDIDLQADQWAGLEVVGKLIVTDAANQKGETRSVVFSIPTRDFYNPLAKAVVEQRQNLTLAPSQWRHTAWAFNGLTLGPEYFYENTSEYLLLRTAMWRVSKRGNTNQTETVSDFWPLALQLEDEALELARRRLEAAQEALRSALENGANDEELEKLTEELRAAMQNYLQQLAQSGQRRPDVGPLADETFDPDDLDRMLDSVRDLAKSGAQNAARQALQELQSILDNLQMSGRGQQGQSGQSGQMGDGQQSNGQQGNGSGGGEATGQAGDLIGRQRDLANRSFQRDQQGGGPGNSTGSAFADEQNGLASDLQNLLQELETGAARADPDGNAANALKNALDNMQNAGEALENDDFGAAGTQMERAISNLRDGAEALADAAGAQRAAGRGESAEGKGATRDPLGRPVGPGTGDGVDVPAISDAERAREILQELRRRLSDGERGEEEIQYLERLLERF